MANPLNTFTNAVKHWYIPLILGIIFILCGVYVFSVPLETYLTLTILFSLSFIISGLLDIIFSIQNSGIVKGWGWYLVNGLLTLIFGIYLVAYPAISVTILPFVVGFVLLFRSFQLFGFALELKDLKVNSWGNLAAASILGILFSFLLIANPFFTGLSIVVLTAMSFIFSGIAAIVLSFSLKRVKNFPGKISNELKTKIESLQNEINAAVKK